MSFKPQSSHPYSPLVLPSSPRELGPGPGVFHIAALERYLSVVGLVAVLYDHVLTFDDEIRVVWTAPRSFAKWMFLLNRYITEACLLVAAHQISGFSTNGNSDEKCQIVVSIIIVYGIFSTLTANVLAFLRVVVLWDKSPRIVLGLSIILTLCTLSTIGSLTATVVILKPTIKYNSLVQACTLTKTGPSVIASFVALTFFELTVLVLTAYNALSRPRDSRNPLLRSLYRDGMLCFAAITVFRLTNLISVSVAQPGIASIPLYFSWAMVTLAINRLLISLRSSEKCGGHDDALNEDVTLSPVSAKSDYPSSGDHGGSIELRSFWEM